MKKLLLTLALLAAASAPTFAQLSVGLGYASDNKRFDTLFEHNSRAWFNGFYVGAGYTLNLLGPLSFTPGVYFNFLNYTDKYKILDAASYNVKFSEIYLKVPATFSLGFDMSDSVRGFVFAGPTFMIGLSSNVKDGYDSENLYSESSYSRFNVLLGGGVGIEICEKLRVTVGYDGGLINRWKGDGKSSLKISDNGLHAGVAYVF